MGSQGRPCRPQGPVKLSKVLWHVAVPPRKPLKLGSRWWLPNTSRLELVNDWRVERVALNVSSASLNDSCWALRPDGWEVRPFVRVVASPTLLDMGIVNLSDIAAAKLAHHVARAATLATRGDVDRCAPEAVLAWAILHTALAEGEAPVNWAESDLTETRSPLVGNAGEEAGRGARALALQLAAHFASVGRADLSSFYQELAATLGVTSS